jgi:hypothetical protein
MLNSQSRNSFLSRNGTASKTLHKAAAQKWEEKINEIHLQLART